MKNAANMTETTETPYIAPEGLYFYKDTYMTGLWGQASRGSFIISNRAIDRPDFRLLLGANFLADTPLADGNGRDFTLWIDAKTPKGHADYSAKLKWVGGKRKLRLADGELAKAADGRTDEEFETLRARLEAFGAL